MADKNPTELLNRLIAENPDADDEKLFRLFYMQCGEHWEEIARQFFSDHKRTLALTPQESERWVDGVKGKLD
jgi:hypothetical protein